MLSDEELDRIVVYLDCEGARLSSEDTMDAVIAQAREANVLRAETARLRRVSDGVREDNSRLHAEIVNLRECLKQDGEIIGEKAKEIHGLRSENDRLRSTMNDLLTIILKGMRRYEESDDAEQ